MNSNYETKVFQVHTEGDRFGFTLAGEYPCQLVKIQHGSPAERAGLVHGDEVLEVNGINMADLQHDLVASFICPSNDGLTEFRIRRYRCDQKTESTSPGSQKPVAENGNTSIESHQDPLLSQVVDRVVEGFNHRAPSSTVTPSTEKQHKGLDPRLFNGSELASDEQLRATFSPETSDLNTFAAGNISTPRRPSRSSSQSAQSNVDCARKGMKIQALLGYLGSIDRPMTTRNAGGTLVTHLRVKRDSSVPALLEISPTGLYLSNSSHDTIMTCSTTSLAFVGMCPENKQIVGLFTREVDATSCNKASVCGRNEITSDLNLNCSCHLFTIESDLTRHPNHKSLTDRFRVRCNSDPLTGSCHQFPTSASAFLNAIYAVLKDSPALKIPSNVTESGCNGPCGHQDEVTGWDCGVAAVGKSTGNDPTAVTGLSLHAQQDGSGQELVLCLHLHPLHQTVVPRRQKMDSLPVREFNSGKSNGDQSTMAQNLASTRPASASEIVTSSTQHIHLTSMSLGVEQPDRPTAYQGSPNTSKQGKDSQTRHKTLVHRRSRSLVSNVKTTLQACQAAQNAESYPRNDFQIGNGVRPIFHSSSASVTTCNIVNSGDGRVARWAVAFDKLLEDPAGLDIFRTFLQKEYSEENLMFWLACKKYKTICCKKALKTSAEEIYEMHLKSSAMQPVNVESSAIREVEGNLENPTPELFAALQHQVYTLMKFDSYTRFLKSNSYRQCMVDEMEGRPLVEPEDTKKVDEFTGTLKRMVKLVQLMEINIEDYSNLHCPEFGSSTKMRGWKSLGKSQNSSETDESKKKSFLPWRGRTKSEQVHKKASANRSSDSQSSTRSSLSSLSDSVFSSTVTNSDETLTDSDGRDQIPPTCRVVLPNRSLMYLFCKSTRSLKEGLSKLCEKKEYSLPSLDLFISNRKLTEEDLQKKLTRFINKEIVLKEGVLFRLQLPNDKCIGVKAEGGIMISRVLEPILRQSGLGINGVTVCLKDNKQPLNTNNSVSLLHKHHVIIEEHQSNHKKQLLDVCKTADNNNEVNKNNEDSVFDAIMDGKRQSMTGFLFDENGVFVPVMKPAGSKELVLSSKDKDQISRSPAFFRKKKQNVSTFKTFIVEDDKKGSEELFTLLRRSQNSRLDDQRGLLNKELELPDFLKLPRKTSIRSSFLNVGVPSPRAHHAPLKKTTSSPPSCTPCTKVTVQTQSSTMTKRTQGTGFFRNLSGSSLSRGRTKVDGAYQTTNQTQTIDRKHFMNKSASGSRMRSGSLQYNNSDVHLDVLGGTELRGQTSSHYRSELSFEKNETQVVWVTTNTTNKNRRRGGGGGGGEGGGGEGGGGGNRTHDAGEEGENEEDGGPIATKAEVIIPDVNRNPVSVPTSSAVGGVLGDSISFREFAESSQLRRRMSSDDQRPGLESTASDREGVLDNSFLREQLKPSRLFSQLSHELSTPPVTSPTSYQRQTNDTPMRCPLFSPSTPNLGGGGGGDDSSRNDSLLDDFPYDNLIFGSSVRSHKKHAGSTNGTRQAVGNTKRNVYWETDVSNEEDSVRVTFV